MIVDNSGGIECNTGSVFTMIGCVYARNGSGVTTHYLTDYAGFFISNSTLVSNGGHAVSLRVAGTHLYNVNIENSIFADNAGMGIEYEPLLEGAALPQINCCISYSNAGGNFDTLLQVVATSNGNSELDPRLCAVDSGDYTVDACSPCIPGRNECGVHIGALGVGCSGYCGPVWHVATTGSDTAGEGSAGAPFATIQAAIDRSWDGDTVLVAPGVYSGDGNRDIDFHGRAIIVMSESGPDFTEIDFGPDSSETHVAFTFTALRDTTAKIEGFHLRSSDGSGTGIRCHYDSVTYACGLPAILNCHFTGITGAALDVIAGDSCNMSVVDCRFSSNGQGILVKGGGPRMNFTKCEFMTNATAVWIWWYNHPESTLITFDSCLFRENGDGISVPSDGFRLDVSRSHFEANAGYSVMVGQEEAVFATTISQCTFAGNSATPIRVDGDYPHEVNIMQCVFENNAGTNGGGISSLSGDASPMIDGCIFFGNQAVHGGAISADNRNPVITDCLFVGNQADVGGAIFCGAVGENSVIVDHCTFVGNSAPTASWIAVESDNPHSLIVTNSVVAYHLGGAIYTESSGTSADSISCCNMYGNSGGDWTGLLSQFAGINGNISADPLFCDTANGDFTIMDISPCAPANNSCGTQIGAFGVGCSGIPAAQDPALLEEVATNVVSHTPAIAWQYSSPVEHPQDSFEVAIGTDTNWSHAEMWNPAPVASLDTSVAYAGAALVDGSDYFGRLRVHNGYTWSPWAPFQFHMNSVPSIPSPLSPIGETTVPTDMPTLWTLNAGDFEGDTLTYDFYGIRDTSTGWKDAAPIEGYGIPEGEDSTGFQVSAPLVDNSHYWWQVRSFDGYEYSAWTDLFSSSFWVNANSQAPSAPMCLTPPDPESAGSIAYDLTPDFCWTKAYDTDPFDTVRYKLNVALDPNFTFSTVVDSFTDTCYSWTDSLEFGEQYWWRVSAHDRTGLTTPSLNTLSFWTWKLGDINHDHQADLSDLIFLVNYLFMGGPPVDPMFTGDVTGDCQVDLSDLIYLVNHLFMGGPGPRVGC